MNEAANSSRRMKLGFWGVLLFMAVYFAATLACLRQWHSDNPWARLDVFSGGYLLLSLLWGAAQTRFHRAIFRSREVMREASGMNFDPAMIRWISLLSLAELLMFVDYGHWHLVPSLQIQWLQWLGLALYLGGGLWLAWVDRFLARHFSGGLESRQLMRDGPYRFVRHPRYVAFLLARTAAALTLASIIGWMLFPAWIILLLRRVRLEEPHLRELFGSDYDDYAARTPRLIPGIY